MSNIVLADNFRAEAAIPAFTIVKFGSADTLVVAAASATDKIYGVTTDIPAAAGERCDVISVGGADVLYGGNVSRGDLLTSDASGRAVTAAPAAGVNNRVIGIAEVSGVAGDIGYVSIARGSTQG